MKLRELIRAPGRRDVELHLRQAEPATYRDVLKEIKSKEIHNLLIDTKPENMHLFLRGVSISSLPCLFSLKFVLFLLDFFGKYL